MQPLRRRIVIGQLCRDVVGEAAEGVGQPILRQSRGGRRQQPRRPIGRAGHDAAQPLLRIADHHAERMGELAELGLDFFFLGTIPAAEREVLASEVMPVIRALEPKHQKR